MLIKLCRFPILVKQPKLIPKVMLEHSTAQEMQKKIKKKILLYIILKVDSNFRPLADTSVNQNIASKSH